jgi:hypothetical protein
MEAEGQREPIRVTYDQVMTFRLGEREYTMTPLEARVMQSYGRAVNWVSPPSMMAVRVVVSLAKAKWPEPVVTLNRALSKKMPQRSGVSGVISGVKKLLGKIGI